VCAWHVHTDFDVRRTSKTFSGKAQYQQTPEHTSQAWQVAPL
jgi:hypothetical protein